VAVSKEIIPLEKSNVKLTLTVPKDDVRSQYQDLLKEYRKKIQIPGFRKGMAPQEVLERKYGDALKGEALGKIIEKVIEEVFTDENLSKQERPLPYSYPQMEETPKLDFDQDLVFSFTFDVLPKIEIGVWKGHEVEVPDAEIGDEDISRELEEIRERNAIVLDKNVGEPAGKDDVVTVNYCETGEGGDVLANSERQDFVFTLGSGYNIYKFDDEITGMKKDEIREFTKTYPDDFENPDLAGKTKKLKVTLTALKEKKLPDLDDEFAQDVDEKYNTLAELKNSIRERLEKRLAQSLKNIKTNKILEKIMETTPVVLPESMIRVELESRWRNLAQRFGTTVEKVMQMMAAGSIEKIEEIQAEWRPSSEKALHSRLIVETLIEQEKFDASDEEMEKELETIAGETGTDLEEIKKYYQDESSQEYLKESIKEHKLFELLIAENTIKTGKKEKYLDLISNNG
jgi:trigger factor